MGVLMRSYSTFYVLDNDEHLVCILKALRFDVVKTHVSLICFYDDRDNVIAYFDSEKFFVRDFLVLFDGDILTGEGIIHG